MPRRLNMTEEQIEAWNVWRRLDGSGHALAANQIMRKIDESEALGYADNVEIWKAALRLLRVMEKPG